MLRNEDDLICDLAEVYGITDMKALPIKTLAALSCGLPRNSRSMMKLSGMKIPLETMLLATIADKLAMLVWLNSADGQKNRNRPRSILSELIGEKEENNIQKYKSGADFEAARKMLIGKEETDSG